MDSDRVGYTIGQIIMFFTMGTQYYHYRYTDPDPLNAAIVVTCGIAGAVFTARSLELF
ncbi:hypothetical protein [Haloarchaeobius iranensis]|uniref:hypothetical protein n=1 Tax=Haloarchaeobius iranensis TaxID=996166 RepID=UPI00158781FB|nr:hypothetical protein [Haloarchaeobius iranensis]